MKNNVSTAWFLASRMFRHGQKSLVITPIAVIAIIYINLLFIPALITGAVAQHQAKLNNTLTSDFVVLPPIDEADILEKNALLDRINSLSDVEASTAVYQVGNRIRSNDKSGYWTVYAIDSATFTKVFNNNVRVGSVTPELGGNAIVLGSRITGSDKEGANYGEGSLGISSTGVPVSILLYHLGDREFITSGIVDNKFYDSDIRAYIDSQYYLTLMPDAADKATAVYVKTKSGTNQNKIKSELLTLIGDARLQDSSQYGASVREQASTMRSINDIVSAMAFLVATITVFIVIYIDILQRRRQIGTQRAIGVSPVAIVYSYEIRAFLYAVLGVLAGGLVFMGALVPYFQRNPFIFLTGEVSLAPSIQVALTYAVMLIVASVIAAWLPARRVTKIGIRETLSE